MLTYEVEILEPKAEAMLADMQDKKLVKLSKHKNGKQKRPLERGSMKGLVISLNDDVYAPLKDFEDYV